MPFVSDVINMAFGDLGLMQFAATVSTDPMNDGLLRLQNMFNAWSMDPLLNNAQYHQSFTPTASVQSYTLGTGGSFVSSVNPLRVYGAQSISGQFSNPVKVVSFEEFDTLVQNKTGSRAALASILAADNAYPAINLKVFPLPSSTPGSLLIEYIGQMVTIATTGQDLSPLAPAYIEAMHYNLAMDLLPKYGREYTDRQTLAANASASLARIQNINKMILASGEPEAAK